MLTLHYIIIEVVVFFDYCYMVRYVQHYNYVQFSVECRKLFSLFFFFFGFLREVNGLKKNRAFYLTSFGSVSVMIGFTTLLKTALRQCNGI